MKKTSIEIAVDHAGSQTKLAKALGVSAGRVWQWVNGWPINTKYFARIEKVTEGKVTPQQLLADELGRKTKDK